MTNCRKETTRNHETWNAIRNQAPAPMTDKTVLLTLKTLARLGYAARGIVYLEVGGLALLAVAGQGGGTTGSKGALREIMSQPLGDLLLLVLIVGLFGFALWRCVQAIRDTDRHGTSAKGIAVRGGLMISALTHGLLAVWASGLLVGSGGGGSQGWLNGLLNSGGHWLWAAVGLAIVGTGLAHIYKGWTAGFERYLEMPPDKARWVGPVCRLGLIARGVVWLMIGGFFFQTAYRTGVADISGMAEALSAVSGSDYASWLLAAVALGLFAFGLYSLIEAMYRRVTLD